MIFSGNQLRAARALLGVDQEALAEKVGVSDNTIRNMEACGAEPVGGFASTRDKVRKALEELGIEFLNGGEPGVRLRKGRKPAASPSKAAPPKKTRQQRPDGL
jgi:transcriptional regulator with XRE-family HTH domain